MPILGIGGRGNALPLLAGAKQKSSEASASGLFLQGLQGTLGEFVLFEVSKAGLLCYTILGLLWTEESERS